MVAYNTILLLIILFYVYPLKFLAKLLTQIYGSLLGKLFGLTMPINHISTEGRNLPELMIIYGAGVSGIFIVLMFMYRYALKNKEELGLNDIEVFETRISIKANLLMAGIPMLSALLALIIGHPAIAGTVGGITYLLYWPVMTIFGKKTSKQRKQILEKSTSIGFSSTSSG
ncbi:MAG TPA: hypothetical protein VFW11_14055 [Cyclobacteriaceae bacterium]|nr:hypothetical protein [Cyclobacteriaceae bacterium]